MAHRSGLVREPPVGNYFDSSNPALAETIKSLNRTALVYAPGTRTKYSNAGIAAVGYVLEKAQKQPFAGYLEREKRGTWAYYSLAPNALQSVSSLISGL